MIPSLKISPDTKDALLFLFGLAGMVIFGGVMPVLGFGFNQALFLAWGGVAIAGYAAARDSRQKANGQDKGGGNGGTSE